MATYTQSLLELTRSLREASSSLESLLQLIVDFAAEQLGTSRASARILDRTRTHLIALCRAGSSLHNDPLTRFQVGEGLMGWVVQHGQRLRTGDADNDPRFVSKPGMKSKMGSFLGVPVIDPGRGGCMGVVCVVHPEPDYFTPEHEELLQLAVSMAEPHIRLQRIQRLAELDPLSRAFNRGNLQLTMPGIPSVKVDIQQGPLSLIALVVQNYDALEAKHHTLLLPLLEGIAQSLEHAFPSEHALVRFNPYTFLVFLTPDTTPERAQALAEQLREACAGVRVTIADQTLSATVATSVAQQHPDEDRDALILRAIELTNMEG